MAEGGAAQQGTSWQLPGTAPAPLPPHSPRQQQQQQAWGALLWRVAAAAGGRGEGVGLRLGRQWQGQAPRGRVRSQRGRTRLWGPRLLLLLLPLPPQLLVETQLLLVEPQLPAGQLQQRRGEASRAPQPTQKRTPGCPPPSGPHRTGSSKRRSCDSSQCVNGGSSRGAGGGGLSWTAARGRRSRHVSGPLGRAVQRAQQARPALQLLLLLPGRRSRGSTALSASWTTLSSSHSWWV